MTTETSAEAAFRWGIYEKALPRASWPEMLGFDFVEMSVDESDERLARLEWPRAERRALHEALADARVTIDTMCLSGHRRHALGSVSPHVRQRALTIMRRAIDFAAEFGIRIVQVAGYDVHYEESTERTRSLYFDGILQSADTVKGPYSDLTGITSPYLILKQSAGKYYRYRGHTPATVVSNPYMM